MVRPVALVVLTLLGLGLSAAGGYATIREGAPYLLEGNSSVSRIAALTKSNAPIALSIDGQRSTLTDCELLTRSLHTMETRAISNGAPEKLLQTCLATATAITAAAPIDSFAWLVAAESSAALDDETSALHHYAMAVQTGPNEEWLAEMRVTFAETNLAKLTPEALKLHEADLAMMVNSDKGLRFLAQRYVAQPNFRPRIMAVVDTLPVLEQRAFIGSVRTQVDRQVAP